MLVELFTDEKLLLQALETIDAGQKLQGSPFLYYLRACIYVTVEGYPPELTDDGRARLESLRRKRESREHRDGMKSIDQLLG